MRQELASHGSRGHTSINGTSQNGSSPRTNGITNGWHHHDTARESTYHGHDREEVTRILLQSLTDLGYRNAAQQLSRDSGYQLELPAVAAFRTAVLQGDWVEAEVLLFGQEHQDDGGVRLQTNGRSRMHSYDRNALPLAEGADTIFLKFLLRQQKYLELLEARDLTSALLVLRTELTPLKRDIDRLHALSALMMCSGPADLRSRAGWDGAHGQSRTQLLSDISKSISPSVMIPEHRLAALLDFSHTAQEHECKYHNTKERSSLYTNHQCTIDDFPLQTMLELKNFSDEVWTIEFSHDGKMLAAAGKEGLVTIWDTRTWQVIHELREHERNSTTDATRGICQLAFSPNDQYLVTCGLSHEFVVTKMPDARIVARGDHFENPVAAVAWLPDSDRFVIGSQSHRRPLSMYSMSRTTDTDSGLELRNNEIYTWRDPPWDEKLRDSQGSPGNPSSYRVADLAVSKDGKSMAASTIDGKLMVFDLDTKAQRAVWDLGGQVTSITFSGDGRHILLNMNEDQVFTIDSTTGDVVTEYRGIVQRRTVIKSCFAGAHENFVVSGSEDSIIRIWRRESGVLLASLPAHASSFINAIAWHPTRPAIFASAGDDRRVRIWTSVNALQRRAIDSHSWRL